MTIDVAVSAAARGQRLLISCVNYAPEILGTAPYTRDVARWFAARGWDVRVVTTYPHYPEWRRRDGEPRFAYRREAADGVAAWRCPAWIPRVPTGGRRLAHYATFAASSLPALLAQVAWAPDVTLVVAPTLACAPGALLTARLARSRTWLHVQDYELDVALRLGLLPARVARLLRNVERRLLRSFDLVSTITREMLAVAESLGVEPEALQLLPNWAFLDEVYPLPRPSEHRAGLGVAGDQRVVLYTGNLGRKQGAELIAETAEASQNAGSRVLYVVAGQGADRDLLEAAVAARSLSNLRLLPLQEGPAFNELLNLADVHLIVQDAGVADLVMPSKLTNMLASGRPVVVTAEDQTGLAVLVRDNDLGVVVPPGDAAALAEAVEALALDDEACARQGAKARAFAQRHLDKDRLLEPVRARLCRMG